jgi:hypothetical protein
LREIAFVGNAPIGADVSEQVDGADHVVRFNKARGFAGEAGRRVDDLFLINCGGQALAWLRDPGFWRSAPLAAAPLVSLPVANLQPWFGLRSLEHVGWDGRHGVNFEHDVRARLRGRPVRVRTMPDAVRRGAAAALSAIGPPPDRPIWPSTGFLALYWYDQAEEAEARLTLHGFGFSGGFGHPWEREREWVARRVAAGRMRLADGRAMARRSA